MLDLEKINQLASKLKRQREKRGLSLEQANKQTRIHLNILRAFEEGNFSVLSPMYIKGFLKRYADFLGLDSQGILNEYMENYPQHTEQVIFLDKAKKKEKIVLDKKKISLAKPIAIFVISIIALFFIVYTGKRAIGFIRSSVKHHRAAKKAAKPISEEPKLIIPLNRPIILTLKATGDAWLQVKADGSTIFTGILKKGDRETWEASDNIQLRTGKAENLLVELNQKPYGKLGKGVYKNISVTREGIKK